MMGCCLLKAAEAPLLHYQRAGVKTEIVQLLLVRLGQEGDIPVNQNTSMQRGEMMSKRENSVFYFKETSTTHIIYKCFIVSF